MISTAASKIAKSEQGMEISGLLVFSNVSDLLEQGNKVLQQHQSESFVINCKEMLRIDSAGIALLIEWQRQCKNINKVCQFINLSKQAQALIEAYRLQFLIAA